MTTKPIREIIIDRCEVTEASLTQGRDGDQWRLRFKVPSMATRYPIGPCWWPVTPGVLIREGATHRIKLRRGELRDNGNPEYESGYFWELEAWDTDEVDAAAQRQPAATRATDDRSAQIAWNSAVNNAVALYAAGTGDIDDPDFAVILEWAASLYPIIIGGPPESEGVPPNNQGVHSESDTPDETPANDFEGGNGVHQPKPAQPARTKPRDCPDHKKPLLNTPDGKPGHPVRNASGNLERWCYGEQAGQPVE